MTTENTDFESTWAETEPAAEKPAEQAREPDAPAAPVIATPVRDAGAAEQAAFADAYKELDTPAAQ